MAANIKPDIDKLKDLQEQLGLTGDGIQGRRTSNAIKVLQEQLSIPTDGIPGPQTFEALAKLDEKELEFIRQQIEAQSVSLNTSETTPMPGTKTSSDTSSRNKKPDQKKSTANTQSFAGLPKAFTAILDEKQLSLVDDKKSALPQKLFPSIATHYSLKIRFTEKDITEWLKIRFPLKFDKQTAEILVKEVPTPPPLTLPLYVSARTDPLEGDLEFSSWCQSNKINALRIIDTPSNVHNITAQLIIGLERITELNGESELRNIRGTLLEKHSDLIFDPEFFELVEKLMESTSNTDEPLDTMESSSSEQTHRIADSLSGYISDDINRRDQLDIPSEVKALCAVIAAREVSPPLSIGLFGDWGTGKSFFIKEMVACINEMAKKARQVEDEKESKPDSLEPDYWSNIAQIKFNAWHYEDADLWASLVVRIFDGLSSHMASGSADTNEIHVQRKNLFNKIQSLQKGIKAQEEHIDKAKSEEKGAQSQLETAEQTLSEAKNELQEIDLDSISKTIFSAYLTKNRQYFGALKALGMEDATEDANTFLSCLQSLKSDTGTLRSQYLALRDKITSPQGIATAGLILFFGVSVGLVVEFLPSTQFWISIKPGIATLLQLFTGLSACVMTVRRWLKPVNSHIKNLSLALNEYEQEYEKKIAEENQLYEAALQQVEIASSKVIQLKQALDKKREQLRLLEHDMDAYRSGRMLHRFLEEKASSQEYKGKLGIIASIREDFENLSNLMVLQSKAKRSYWEDRASGTRSSSSPEPRDENSGPKNANLDDIDRIVLYIDDLDRCTPERVIEVLHAVHLLLAFKLFVVVVAVDSRWLVNSLRHSMKNLTSSDNFPETSNAFQINELSLQSNLISSPQNYLEKIFQIPYTLKPMGRKGLSNILESLSSPIANTQTEKKAEERQNPNNDSNETPEAEGADSHDQNNPGSGDAAKIDAPERAQSEAMIDKSSSTQTSTGTSSETSTTSLSEKEKSNKEAPVDDKKNINDKIEHQNTTEEENRYKDVPLNLPRSHINRYELEFMKNSYESFYTPRAANRFVNTYRLIRISVEENELSTFFNEEKGDYKSAIILLIILVGFPGEAEMVFRKLLTENSNNSWKVFINSLPSDKHGDNPNKTDRLKRMGKVIDAIQECKPPGDKSYKKWVYKVARFSFKPIKLPSTKI